MHPREIANNPGSVVAVGITSTPVVATDRDRAWIYITNDSDTAVYLAIGGPAVVGRGIRLNPNGGSFSLENWLGDINGIHGGTGTKNLAVTEI